MATNAGKVLVVDDDPDFVEITRTVLQDHGFQVTAAASGAQALEAMRRERPDAVILDVMMQGATDGQQVSQIIHNDPQLSGVPVLMVTSIMDSPMLGQFPTDEPLPVEAFLSKPVSPQQLVERVRAAIKK